MSAFPPLSPIENYNVSQCFFGKTAYRGVFYAKSAGTLLPAYAKSRLYNTLTNSKADAMSCDIASAEKIRFYISFAHHLTSLPSASKRYEPASTRPFVFDAATNRVLSFKIEPFCLTK